MSVNPVDQPMMRRFGDRATFAIEVGGLPAYVIEAGFTGVSQVRMVDIWAGGRWLTCHDNAAFVPTLVHDLRCVAELVRRREVPRRPFPWRSPADVFRILSANDSEFRTRFWLLRNWDEILDNVETYTWLDDPLVVAFRIRKPFLTQVFVARVHPDEFVSTLDDAAGFLGG
jgi:hypothetical protein